MKAGGGSGHGAVTGGKQGLIVGGVCDLRSLGPANIGRQRHLSVAAQRVEQFSLVGGEGQFHLAALPLGRHLGREVGREDDLLPRPQPLGRTGEGQPAAGTDALVQRNLHPRLAPPAHQPGRNYPGVVEHQQVARPQQRRQLEDTAVAGPVRPDRQQPGMIARPDRMVGDSGGRQNEIEIGGFHGSP